ncbi:MAG: DUF3352 domain-containing protein, partial [Patescibacteria group bacterium]
MHTSLKGAIPEQYLPADIAMVLSYSLMDEAQFETMQTLQTELGDPDKFSKAFTDTVSKDFQDTWGLDFETDLMPAFGEQFRVVFAGRPAEVEGEVEAFFIGTLSDPKKLEEVFQRLEGEEKISKMPLSDFDAWTKEGEDFYATIDGDLLLAANTPENLQAMKGMEEGESLWSEDAYQADLAELGQDHVFYGILYPGKSAENLELPSGLSLQNMPEVISSEALVLRAEDNGFRINGYAKLDKEKADENDISFDNVPKSKPYLVQEIPSEGLMGYVESFGLKQAIDEAYKLDTETDTLAGLETSVQNYLGMDLRTEILTFMDKGYAFALHKNLDGVLPGISFFVDVSSDEENAQRFLDKVDGQITGLMTVLESAFPGAVTRGNETIDGSEFTTIELDLGSLPQTGSAPLPAAITGSPMKLSFGLMGDRLLLTTAVAWAGEGDSITDSDFYKNLSAEMEEASEGLILLDAQGVSDYAGSLRTLREQLGLTVAAEFDIEAMLD